MTGASPIRVLRIIARMNVGGPAYQVILLTSQLDPGRYESRLLAGAVGPGEDSFDDLADASGARWAHVPGLRPEIAPLDDLRALRRIAGEIRRFRPHIVHTHAAKAGTLGRLAALIAGGPRPVLVHTYHGHVLSGYFGPVLNAVYRTIERLLGRATDCLIGVGQATVDELVALRVAPRERFRVVRLGLQLERFFGVTEDDGAAFRRSLGLEDGEVLATFLGRLVPIKRVDVLLDAFARVRGEGVPIRLAVVGDGPLREALVAQAERLGVADHVSFLGYRRDLEAIAAATDIATLSSDNEGTPVFLIESGAAARPAVATDVGAVREVVTEEGGLVVPPRDPAAFADALAALAADPARRRAMGERARAHVRGRYAGERLVADIDALYGELLERRGAR